MTDQTIYLSSAAMGLISVGLMSVVALRGWRDWIGLKRFELEHASVGGFSAEPEAGNRATGNRIEMADLRERVRKLEAIAAGVDL